MFSRSSLWQLGQEEKEFLPWLLASPGQPDWNAVCFQGAVFVLQPRDFHSVLQMVLEEVPEPMK